MSLELAHVWANAAMRNPRARKNVKKHFDEAAAKKVEASLLVAPELTVSRRGYFVRWTGRELAVVELDVAHQRAFGVARGGLFVMLESAPDGRELSAANLVSLTDVRIDDADGHDPRDRLTGRCSCAMTSDVRSPLHPCAFRVRYFHPRLDRGVTAFSYVEQAIVRDGELQFGFPPLVAKGAAGVDCKSLILFLQLIASDGRHNNGGFHCLSNVATAIVDVKLKHSASA